VYVASDLARERTEIPSTNLAVAEVREKLAVSKRATQKFGMERFSLKKLNEVKGKEQSG
jgi:hypothetical protein